MTIVQSNEGGVAAGVHLDREAILRALSLDPRDPKVQALVLVCQQYGLDPVLKHAVLISGNLYVTRDGLLHVAHRDGRLDGITVDEEGQTAEEWWAKVSVHVKGQTHPYTYRGRYPKNGNQKRYGPEMAVKCAEVAALRRAFGVTGIATVEEQWEAHDDAIAAEVVVPPTPDDPLVGDDDRAALVAAMDALPAEERKVRKQEFVQRFGLPQHLRQSQLEEARGFAAGPATPASTGEGDPAPDGQEAAPSGSVEPPGVNGSPQPGSEGSPPAPPEPDTQGPPGDVGEPAVAAAAAGSLDSRPVATQFHDAVKAALPHIPANATESILRHKAILQATGGRTEDWRECDEAALTDATHRLLRVVAGELVLAETSMSPDGWILRSPGPNDRVGPDHIGLLRELLGEVKGMGEAKCLTLARQVAEERGLEQPGEFVGISEELAALVAVELTARAEAQKTAA